MRYLFTTVLIFILTGCNSKNDRILITYDPGLVLTNVARRCEKLAAIQELHPKNEYSYVMSDGLILEYLIPQIIDTFIVDKIVIDRIVELLDKKTQAPDYSEDARMYVTIKKNGKQDYLCFDYFPDQVKYNGQSYSMDKELLFLLRYYSGYYSWFDESDLNWFDELRDPELYRKALEQIKLREEKFSLSDYPELIKRIDNILCLIY